LGGTVGLLVGLWSSDLLVASLSKMIPLDLVWEGGANLFAVRCDSRFLHNRDACFRARASNQAFEICGR